MDRLKTAGLLALVFLALPLLLAWVAVYLAWLFVWGTILRVWFWRKHAIHGRPLFFVYSDSPNWQDYVEANILPHVADHAVVLNWSERRLWPSTSPWESHFFHRFAGDRNFNPMALVFCRGGRIKAVRFHKAFLDYKHGKDSGLRAAEAELFALLESAARLQV